jgi:very-short-patch-repair endonuclease
MKKAEIVLWSKPKNRHMHDKRFLRQYSVEQYVIDFYCPELKLAIEVDGDSHFTSGAVESDRERQQHIEAYGIKFLRFTNADVCDNLYGVLQVIYNTIEMDTIKVKLKSG